MNQATLSSANVLKAVDEARVSLGLSKAELARKSGLRLENVRRLLVDRSAHPQLESILSMLRPLGLALAVVPRDQDEPLWEDVVLARLAHYGAPLYGEVDAGDPGLEIVLADGLVLARENGSVARALPCAFWKCREKIYFPLLLEESLRRGQGQALGFFLDLTIELAKDRWAKNSAHRQAFEGAARSLHVRHMPLPLLVKPSQFFASTIRTERQLAEIRTPDVAKRWGFRMNMDLECFASLFRKVAS